MSTFSADHLERHPGWNDAREVVLLGAGVLGGLAVTLPVLDGDIWNQRQAVDLDERRELAGRSGHVAFPSNVSDQRTFIGSLPIVMVWTVNDPRALVPVTGEAVAVQLPVTAAWAVDEVSSPSGAASRTAIPSERIRAMRPLRGRRYGRVASSSRGLDLVHADFRNEADRMANLRPHDLRLDPRHQATGVGPVRRDLRRQRHCAPAGARRNPEL